MNRRTAILGLGGLVAGGGAAMGTGAFTSVEAERDVDVTLTGDLESYLALQPVQDGNVDDPDDRELESRTPEAQSDPFAAVDESTGRLTLNVTALNADAVTVIPNLFEIRHQGVNGRDVTVHIEQNGANTDVLTFFALDDSGNRVGLGPGGGTSVSSGERVIVNVEADTNAEDISPGDDIINSIVVNGSARGDDT